MHLELIRDLKGTHLLEEYLDILHLMLTETLL